MFNYMKLIPEVKISIDSKSVVKDEGSQNVAQILDVFSCLICYKIPVDTLECEKCDSLFCKKCIHEYIKNNRYACPKCKQETKYLPINRILKQITQEALKFNHNCTLKEEISDSSQKYESLVSKFKKTDAYNKILESRKPGIESSQPSKNKRE